MKLVDTESLAILHSAIRLQIGFVLPAPRANRGAAIDSNFVLSDVQIVDPLLTRGLPAGRTNR